MKDNIWGAVCVKLLQGPIYRAGVQDSTWNCLTTWTRDIDEYFSRMNLSVSINNEDGYAYLVQNEDDGEGTKIPKLIKKAPLTIELSLLCVLLREALDNFDISESKDAFLVMKESEIRDMMSPYMKDIPDQTRIFRKIEEYLNQLLRLSFIREIGDGKSDDREFEIRRIIKAKISPSFMKDFKDRLNTMASDMSITDDIDTDDSQEIAEDE